MSSILFFFILRSKIVTFTGSCYWPLTGGPSAPAGGAPSPPGQLAAPPASCRQTSGQLILYHECLFIFALSSR